MTQHNVKMFVFALLLNNGLYIMGTKDVVGGMGVVVGGGKLEASYGRIHSVMLMIRSIL